jgi:anthranilate phosphoribosyltransferase
VVIIRDVLLGRRRGAARDLVVLNAAAALHVRTGDGLRECAGRAQRAIDEGAALAKLEALIAMSHSSEAAQEMAQ